MADMHAHVGGPGRQRRLVSRPGVPLPVLVLLVFLSCDQGKRKHLPDAMPAADVSELVCAARLLAIHDELPAAASKLEEALAIEGDSVMTLARLAGIKLRVGDPEEARWLLDKAIQKAPDAAGLYYRRAQVNTFLLDITRQLADLEKAASLAPHVPSIQYVRARSNASAGHARRADEAFLALSNTGQWRAATWRLQLTLASLAFRSDEYMRLCEALVASGHEDAAMHCGRAVILKSDGVGADAERALRRAIQLDPEHAQARMLLASILAEDGRLDEAAEHARAAEEAGCSLDNATAKILEGHR